MKAISLWQPWASAVALGYKNNETRHWRTHHRGALAIHAAKRITKEQLHFGRDVIRDEFGLPFPYFHEGELPLGAIVAVVDLVRVVPTEDDALQVSLTRLERALGNYGPARFAWVFQDIYRLPEPIPCTGRQGLFDVPDILRRRNG